MARQFSMPYQIPPVCLLPPAADAAGRTSPFRDLKNALKAYIVCHVNQGNAATVKMPGGDKILGIDYGPVTDPTKPHAPNPGAPERYPDATQGGDGNWYVIRGGKTFRVKQPQ